MSLTSYDDIKGAISFNGTSSAAPQVTAALAVFMHITNSRINTTDALRLLKKTALPIYNIPSPSRLGAGMLNSYKIANIAKKINKACQNQSSKSQSDLNSCVSKEINKESYFDENLKSTSNSSELKTEIESSISTFPECTEEKQIQNTTANCEERKKSFSKLRKFSFLYPNESIKILNVIACIYEKEGYLQNAVFYKNLSKRLEPETENKLNQFSFNDILDENKNYKKAQYLEYKLSSSVIDKLVPYLKDKDVKIRIATLKAFSDFLPTDLKTHLAITQSLKDPDSNVRIEAANAFSKIKPMDPKIQQAIAQSLKDPSSDVKIAAANAFYDIRPTDLKIQRSLADNLDSNNIDVLRSAALALRESQTNDQKILLKLVSLLKNPDENIRFLGEDVLTNIDLSNTTAILAIVDVLKNEDQEIRNSASYILMNIYPKEPKVHSKIIEILNNSDLAIRNEALEVLLDIEPTDQSILESIKKLKSKYPEDAEFQDKINRILSRNK